VARQSAGPVAEFCAGLRRLVQDCGLDRAMLARRLGYSRSQLYEILDGRISRPPEWDRLVEPLIRACIGDDERALGLWRRRHEVLVAVHGELKRQQRRDELPALVGAARVVPAQLPADVEVFTGRSHELAELDCLLAGASDTSGQPDNDAGPTAVVISAVSGTAGVGKTALALRWAHRVRGEFPDGQLYINLHGFDPEPPLSSADALAGFLRALGLAGTSIPVSVEERAAAFRSAVDGRRMLILLDNAASVEQIRLLLPGTPSCVVVVTSRDSLVGLVARHSARRLDLDLLPLEEAVSLLGALIGARVAAEPAATVTLARLCARLPLALRVAAELAVARPAIGLAQLVSELADEQRRLELLDAGGDDRTAVRGVFSWSYRHLPAVAARAFRLIGLHPGPDFDLYAVAALTDASAGQAQQAMDLLSRAHLIQSHHPGRYCMHDLLRAYAARLAAAEDSEPEQRAALTRLFDHYLATAAAAVRILLPAEQHHWPRIPLRATPAPPMPDPATARAWLDAERATLVNITAYTAEHGWPGHTTRLSATLYRYLNVGGYFPEGLVIHTHALHAANHSGDRAAEANALRSLGHIYWQQGQYGHATDHLQHALALAGEISDRVNEGRALLNLGVVYQRQGYYEQSAEHLERARDEFREIGDQVGEAHALLSLGVVDRRQGRNQQAADHYQQALALFREIGDQDGEANALDNLGTIYQRERSYAQAIDHHHQALALFREMGNRHGEANALLDLGTAYRRQGNHQQAAEHHQQALALAREIRDIHREACALNRLGETLVALGQLGEALTHYAAALVVATEIGEQYEQARAHSGLAGLHLAAGDADQARTHWHQALALYTDLGVPNANEVHTSLAALDQAPPGVIGITPDR
jgi:tetratricopeptide (TPR) repeat protein